MFNHCQVTIHVHRGNEYPSAEAASVSTKPMKDQQLYYLQRAAHAALRSNIKSFRHGCVIVHNPTGKILAEGYNHKDASHGLSHIDSIHAEMHAVQRYKGLRKQYPNCSIYIVRIGPESQGNPLRLSHPCCRCSETIRKVGIRHVYSSVNSDHEVAYTQICSLE